MVIIVYFDSVADLFLATDELRGGLTAPYL